MTISRKKGETVHMYAFTGMYIGEFEITASDKKSVSIVQKNGRTTQFDRETGKQINAKTPGYESRVTEEKLAPKKGKPAAKKTVKAEPEKKAKKKAAPEPDDEPDEEELPAPKKPKKADTVKKKKKPAPKAEDEDEYEEDEE